MWKVRGECGKEEGKYRKGGRMCEGVERKRGGKYGNGGGKRMFVINQHS